ncbi:MAG: NADH-quinone oxidoreductase subunit C [Bacteroidetes bacterium]|nr:MAG: NADH-quinone oxidoreductase subunit C [Bacteroidota bacterium]
MPISNEILIEKLTTKFGENIIKTEEQYGILCITAKPTINIDILHFLYDDTELQFQFLTDICGVHYPDELLQLCVVYHLHSLVTNTRIRFKFYLPLDKPEIKTATSVYASANWMERETFDFYGIIFTGHPNLKRILNVDDMTVYPMRKEYPLEDPNRVDKKDLFFGR